MIAVWTFETLRCYTSICLMRFLLIEILLSSKLLKKLCNIWKNVGIQFFCCLRMIYKWDHVACQPVL